MAHTPFMNLDDTHRKRLFALARQSIEHGLVDTRLRPMAADSYPNALSEPRATFVTLRIEEELRGCCGNLDATRPLAEDVWRNAWASAFSDPRFSPLQSQEWPRVDLHISVLSALEPLPVTSEKELLDELRPNIDGIVLARDLSRATFLPVVWEQLPDPIDFVRHLKQKAGWSVYGWSPQIKVWRYTTESFGERDFHSPPP
jgi:AmmeMemoRadiSam system protein A